jgi:exportin-T
LTRHPCVQVIRGSYGSFKDDEKTEVKAALLLWLQRDCGSIKAGGLPPFLRNKLAQTLVAVLLYEYPSTWPRFFQDLISAMKALGDGLVDMFCRILVSVDEDLVSLDIPRSQDESKLSMHVKDSMREFSISDIAAAWIDALEAYKDSHPDLATLILLTMQRYVSWIDIGLVANDESMTLLLGLLDSSPSASLRGASADCLSEVVSKRMDAVPKLTLIQTMAIVPRCSSWANGFPLPHHLMQGQRLSASQEVEDERQTLVVKMARLLATLATEVIDSLKRIENQVISFSAMGLSVDDEAAEEVRAASNLGNLQMQALFPALLSAFQR